MGSLVVPTDRIIATYQIETPYALEYAAEVMAGEQSTGTFVRVPGETDELRARFAARVERVTEIARVDAPSLPFCKQLPQSNEEPIRYRRAEVVLSFPLENVGPSLPNLVSTVAGNLYELREFSGLRLMDVDLPEAFAQVYPGPQFGIEGTRKLADVQGRPINGTIVKPSVGLTPEETARLVRTLGEAGLDFIKDDELMANPPHSPLRQRMRAVMREIDDLAQRTGKKVMYAFNITDDMEVMLRHHDDVVRAGGTCVMVSLNSVGLSGIAHLRRHSRLPIHGHRNGWGALTRCPQLGFEFVAYQKLWRLAGVDHLHVNGLKNKFWEPDESVIRSAQACLTPMFGGYQVLPVFSSAQWAGQAPDTYRQLRSIDLMYLCGGGIMAHPGGVAAGVASIRQAWEAALAGTSLEDHSKDRVELRQALAAFSARV